MSFDGMRFHIPLERRRFLRGLVTASAGFTLPGYLAEALTLTPSVGQGPFYPLPHNIPLDKDNDLIRLNDSLTEASGIVTYVHGRVLDRLGQPVRGALVELWHADAAGHYSYWSAGERNPSLDPHFAGFGQFLTGGSGQFLFRTLKPGLYPGRARHFHWGVTLPGHTRRASTQTGWDEVARDAQGNRAPVQNENDGLFGSIADLAQRASILLSFSPMPGIMGAEQAAWDYVSGSTPVEPVYPEPGGMRILGQAIPNGRFKISFAAQAGYSYEVYANPSLQDRSWRVLPFSVSESGKIDRNIHTAQVQGPLELFVDAPGGQGFYFVAFRVPGANLGTP